MDTEPATVDSLDNVTNDMDKEVLKRLSSDSEDNTTIHAFNMSNVTVIEKEVDSTNISGKPTSCEGSDSGVEVIENCTLQRASSINSTNSQDFGSVTPACSFGSSIISCCSNYEDAYNLLARRNSSLLEDYKLSICDGTSEVGSESSSVAGSGSSKNAKRTNTNNLKKKINSEGKGKLQVPSTRSRAPVTPRNSVTRPRGKSIDTLPLKSPGNKNTSLKPKIVPTNLTLSASKKDSKSKDSSRGSSSTRTPATTPTDDGRWPSIHSKPAPLMSKSMRGYFGPESKSTIEKYGTLPRRRKQKSAENLHLLGKTPNNRLSSVKHPSSTPKSLPPYPKKKSAGKTKIYHEINTQTALTQNDIEKALAGLTFQPATPSDVEKLAKEVQVDIETKELEKLKEQLRHLQEKHQILETEYKVQEDKLCGCEQRLKEEISEKDGLKDELKQNTERVLAILGNDSDIPDDENTNNDSLMVLETRYQKVGQIMIKQENEISDLNALCRSLQRDLERNIAIQRTIAQQQEDLENESLELQEFMQVEKLTLTEALKDSENEIKKLNILMLQKDKELENKQEESKRLIRVTEQKRQENITVQARLGALEIQSRELLKYQGGHISSAAVALHSLIFRLEGLVEELVNSYNISEQELEDLIFHNEAYTHSSSSPDATPEKQRKFLKERSPSPKRGSTFVSAIINAIKNATTHKPFSVSKDLSKDTISMDNSDSVEMLDSETEPCLMMEHVLEDVLVPDGHSHNMISFGHGMINSTSLTCSDSFTNSTNAILHRQLSEPASLSMTGSFHSDMSSLTEIGYSTPLVDQVIEVDNVITRLLKVLRIIQMENDEYMDEVQDERDQISDQIIRQKEANKIVVKQLQDWEVLGSHLKSEVTELMQQVCKKHNEIDNLKAEVNVNHKEIERLNEDVCTLSTICSKYELELKIKHQEALDSINKWETTEEMPTKEVLATIFTAQRKMPILKDKLIEKEKQLTELKQEFVDSKHLLSNNLKEALGETSKQYNAIESALEILHSIQTVVQQCPPLTRLQRDATDSSLQNITVVGTSDCNINGTSLNPVSLEIPLPINSTA